MSAMSDPRQQRALRSAPHGALAAARGIRKESDGDSGLPQKPDLR